jgi:hypothetical protein
VGGGIQCTTSRTSGLSMPKPDCDPYVSVLRVLRVRNAQDARGKRPECAPCALEVGTYSGTVAIESRASSPRVERYGMRPEGHAALVRPACLPAWQWAVCFADAGKVSGGGSANR